MKAPVDYADALEMVEHGVFVVCTPVGPAVAWLVARLDGKSHEIAFTGGGEPKLPESSNTDDDEIRAAQAIGIVAHLRRHTRRTGHKPA